MTGSTINDIKFDTLTTAGYAQVDLQGKEYAYYLTTYTFPPDFPGLRQKFLDAEELHAWEDEIAFWTAGLGGSYSAEAEALFAAMSVAPDTTRKGIIDTLITTLKTGSVWTQLDALYVFAAHDEQAARLNWIAPGTNTATTVNSPTFSVDGYFQGNGTTSYLDLNINASGLTNFTRDDNCYGAYVVGGTEAVSVGGNSQFTINPRNTSNKIVIRDSSTSAVTQTGTTADGSGLTIATRTNSSNFDVYQRGTFVQTMGSASQAITSQEMFSGATNTAGVAGSHGDWQIQAKVIGGGLSAGEVTILNDALVAYIAAL